jgi:hypothetical protein
MSQKKTESEPNQERPKTEQEERLHPLLSNAEVEEIRAEARAKLEKERLAAAKKSLLAEETERLRMEEGLVTGGPSDEMVEITIVLAQHSDRLLINMRPYWHGRTYRVPRHVANSMREMMFRGERHESEIKGNSMASFYMNARETKLSPVKGSTNAPRRFDA